MKKKWLCGIVLLFLALFTVSAGAISIEPGYDIGDVLSSDIRAYINNYRIRSYNIDGKTAVLVEDLEYYGYQMTWYQNERTVVLNRKGRASSPYIVDNGPSRPVGIKRYDVISSDIKVYFGTRSLPSFSVNGYTAVYLEDLAINGAGVSWEPKSRIIQLTSPDRYYNSSAKLTMLGTGFFSNKTNEAIITSCFYDLNTQKVVTYDDDFSYITYKDFVAYKPHQDKQYLLLGYVLKNFEYDYRDEENPFYRTELSLVTSSENIERVLSDLSDMVKAKSQKVLEEAWLFSQRGDYESAHAVCNTFLANYDYPEFAKECGEVRDYKDALVVKKVRGEANKVLREAKAIYDSGDYNGAIDLCVKFGDLIYDDARLEDIAYEVYGYAYEVADVWRAKSGPLAVVGFRVQPETDRYYGAAYFQFRNVSYKPIVAYQLTFDCYDVYGNPVKSKTYTHRAYASSENEYIISLDPCDAAWVLSDFLRPYWIRNVRVTTVVFSDGSVWYA